MYTLPNSPKKICDRAKRYKRSLTKEQKECGYIRDGTGKRYLIGPLFVLSGDIEKAIEYFEWYEKEFSDDSGEPLHYVHWTIALLRSGNEKKAVIKVAEALLQNIYLLPEMVGIETGRPDIWHSSNFEKPDYINDIPKQLLPSLSEDEAIWIRNKLECFWIKRVVQEHIKTYQLLKHEKDIPKRMAILDGFDRFVERSLSEND